jgi:hypothetical protein
MQQVLFVNLILVAAKESDFFLLVQLPLKRRSMLELAAAVRPVVAMWCWALGVVVVTTPLITRKMDKH